MYRSLCIEPIDIQSAKKVLSEICWSQDMNKCGMAKSSKCRCNICLPFFITADISISVTLFHVSTASLHSNIKVLQCDFPI